MVPAGSSAMRVMLATDDSGSARIAEDWVSRLRYPSSPVVEVVTVARPGITRLGWGIQTYREPVRLAWEGIRQGERDAAERIANEVGERLQAQGFIVHTWARQGECAEELLLMASVEEPDLVVVGPRGRSGLAASMLGSVSHGLIANMTRPLLVARPAHASEGPLPTHVMLVVDGGTAVEPAVTWLDRSGWLDGARLTMIGLLGERAGLEDHGPQVTAEVARVVHEEASQVLDRLTGSFADRGVAPDTVFRGGHPLQATLEAIDVLGVDLVAVARPPAGVGRDPLAQKIARHAPVSVLLVPQA